MIIIKLSIILICTMIIPTTLFLGGISLEVWGPIATTWMFIVNVSMLTLGGNMINGITANRRFTGTDKS